MLTSIDMQRWNSRPTSLDYASPAPSVDAEFERQVQQLRQEFEQSETTRTPQVRNLLVTSPNLRDGKSPSLVRPLRISVEDYGPEGAIAFLVSDKTFSGFGKNLPEAVRELMGLLLHDHQFYESTPEEILTADALESRAMLRKLFAEPQ